MELLKIKEASQFLKLSPSTLYYLVETCQIPHIRLGKAIRFIKEDLEKFIEKSKIPVLKNDK